MLSVPLAGAGVGILLCTGMVWRTTGAMFTGSAANPSTFATGSVVVGDDATGSALFSSGTDGLLTGGQSLTRCIKVTYSGTVTTGVQLRLYAATTGALPAYLDLTVDEGTGGGFGSCGTFSTTTAGLYSGTLAGFASSVSSFGTGVSTWAPSATGVTRTYRFTVTAQSAAAAQASTGTATFTWEARA